MKLQRIAIIVTVINLVLMAVLLAKINPAGAQKETNKLQVIRGSGLEIVDSSGKLRASITFQSPGKQNGITYPGGILLRLIDSKGQPVVKIEGSEEGGGLSFSNESEGYIQVIARESGGFLKIKNPDGKEQVIKP
ncbi:MAG TPA: hypothetical protein VFW07_27805 [Parafilimonas sp.]|nr:hypothetical protein [Parafilimonas sp.]